jgi:ABC-type polysaccharide/polyol phosphate transport system ATPase subunit
MSVREISQPAHGNSELSARGHVAVRLNVEQASFAYSANALAAPTFTLAATSFQARERELVAILGHNASGKSSSMARKPTGSIRGPARSASP